jgi:hypothetical protein
VPHVSGLLPLDHWLAVVLLLHELQDAAALGDLKRYSWLEPELATAGINSEHGAEAAAHCPAGGLPAANSGQSCAASLRLPPAGVQCPSWCVVEPGVNDTALDKCVDVEQGRYSFSAASSTRAGSCPIAASGDPGSTLGSRVGEGLEEPPHSRSNGCPALALSSHQLRQEVLLLPDQLLGRGVWDGSVLHACSRVTNTETRRDCSEVYMNMRAHECKRG